MLSGLYSCLKSILVALFLANDHSVGIWAVLSLSVEQPGRRITYLSVTGASDKADMPSNDSLTHLPACSPYLVATAFYPTASVSLIFDSDPFG